MVFWFLISKDKIILKKINSKFLKYNKKKNECIQNITNERVSTDLYGLNIHFIIFIFILSLLYL